MPTAAGPSILPLYFDHFCPILPSCFNFLLLAFCFQFIGYDDLFRSFMFFVFTLAFELMRVKMTLFLWDSVSYRWDVFFEDCPATCGHEAASTISGSITCKADDGFTVDDTFCEAESKPRPDARNCPATDICLPRIQNITDCTPPRNWTFAGSICAPCAAAFDLAFLEQALESQKQSILNISCETICAESDDICVTAFDNPNPTDLEQCFQQKIACDEPFVPEDRTRVTCQCTTDYKKKFKACKLPKSEETADIPWVGLCCFIMHNLELTPRC